MDGMDAEILAAWEQGKAWLRDAGAELVDISLAHTKYALPAYYIIAPAEAPRISPATTACATACASERTGKGYRTCMRKPGPPVSATRSSAAS
jgi:Asp-tRNA(Asn)/Glu-tRNA(Gln) amidotransferase A subunit family amidase